MFCKLIGSGMEVMGGHIGGVKVSCVFRTEGKGHSHAAQEGGETWNGRGGKSRFVVVTIH